MLLRHGIHRRGDARRTGTAKGADAPGLALEVILQASRALAAAEACGVVHRDIKPSNLMIASRQGESEGQRSLVVKMIDFGVAKVANTGIDQTRADFIGTPAFASPEQFDGTEHTPVDTRSDIYSLGITFWYLLSGRTPFIGRTFEEIRAKAIRGAAPGSARDLRRSAPVTGLLKSMLAVDPAARPQSARELLAAVHRCCQRGTRKSPQERRRKRAGKKDFGLRCCRSNSTEITGDCGVRRRTDRRNRHRPCRAFLTSE